MPIAPFDPTASALLLDVDGTVLDLAPTPGAVYASGDLKSDLLRIHGLMGGALAFVSGRPITDIDRIFAPLVFPTVGAHGAELRLPSGSTVAPGRVLDDMLRRRLRALADARPGIVVEDKGFSVALHFRLAPEWGGWLQNEVATLCAAALTYDLVVLPGKCVVEIKRTGYDKGSAVRELMRYEPFASRRPIFIGDDVTDLPAFVVMPDFGGVGYSVGRTMDGAAAAFSAPGEVRDWLQRIAQVEDAAR